MRNRPLAVVEDRHLLAQHRLGGKRQVAIARGRAVGQYPVDPSGGGVEQAAPLVAQHHHLDPVAQRAEQPLHQLRASPRTCWPSLQEIGGYTG